MRSALSHRRIQRRHVIALAVVAALAAGGVAAWLLRPRPASEPPRARQYIDFTACLLTDEQGIQSPQAAPVWAGMQDASLATHAKVQYLSVSGPQTVDNAAAFLASLTQGRCNLVFATGDTPVTATRENAAKFPTVAFYIVGAGANTANLTHIPANTEQTVNDIVTKAANKSRR